MDAGDSGCGSAFAVALKALDVPDAPASLNIHALDGLLGCAKLCLLVVLSGKFVMVFGYIPVHWYVVNKCILTLQQLFRDV
jgi:hypothetical protein